MSSRRFAVTTDFFFSPTLPHGKSWVRVQCQLTLPRALIAFLECTDELEIMFSFFQSIWTKESQQGAVQSVATDTAPPSPIAAGDSLRAPGRLGEELLYV